MGRVGLETLRMTIYMAFPVVAFHIFNQPAYFEKWVTRMKRELYPPENEQNQAAMEALKRKIQQREREELMVAIREKEIGQSS